MTIGTNCKFCKRPISVEIADDYAAMGDPHKLIPMAACNPCADNRVEKRRIEKRVQYVARTVELAGTRDAQTNARPPLIKLTQDYARLIARWHGRDGMAWDQECVELILDKPREWGAVLSGLWKLFKTSTQNQ
jgi:hypothetical protein